MEKKIEHIQALRFMHRINRLRNRIYTSFSMRKVDKKIVPTGKDEIRLFMAVRNESLRLPFILDYYTRLGVNRMFIIDNNSNDDSASFLLSKNNTHVFWTKEDYCKQGDWVDFLLHRYGKGHWCIVVDADELLFYPHSEMLSLRDLCAFLDSRGYNALDCLLLDMYPNKPLSEISYVRGSDFLITAPYFDQAPYYSRCGWSTARPKVIELGSLIYTGPARFFGGVRKRIFGIEPCLSKFSLVKFNPSLAVSPGGHWAEGVSVASIRGALLHFKFLNDFPDRVVEEVGREQHWLNASEYKSYLKITSQNPRLNFYHDKSVKFINSEQLVNLEIMKSSAELSEFIRARLDREALK